MHLRRWDMLAICGTIVVALILVACDAIVNIPTEIPSTPSPSPPTNTATPTPTAVPTTTPIPPTAMRPDSFTGTYISDNRPIDINFLSLTQSGTDLSGYLTSIVPDGKGSTKAVTLLLDGTTDGNNFTLSQKSLFTGWIYTGNRETDNIVFSYPSSTGQIGSRVMRPASQSDFNQLLASWQAGLFKQAHPAYLGVSWTPLTVDLAEKYNIKDDKGTLMLNGMLVLAVVPSTPADFYDVRVNDVIENITQPQLEGSAPPMEGDVLPNLLYRFNPGDVVTLTIFRNGKQIEVQVTLGMRP